MLRPAVVLGWVALMASACAPKWRSDVLIDGRKVAQALHDPVELAPTTAFDPSSIPDFKAPQKTRPCCAFGMDLKAEVGAVPVPLYQIENIVSPTEIGPHGYDKGELTPEHNGLVYTCRGGFIDLAHVRDTGDNTLFLAMQIARELPAAITIQMPDQGTKRRILIKAMPPELLARHGRWATATVLASWIAYELSIWHEVVTWYGWESTKGFSEKLSAFSPEDLYSNIVGINIAAGIALDREASSRDQYDASMQAWIREAMRRLGAVPKEQGKVAMKAVDGLWWDSSKRVPEFKLVTHRSLAIRSPVSPWIVADVASSPDVQKMCPKQPEPLPLQIADKLGNTEIESLVEMHFEFADWVPSHFPLPAAKGKAVLHTDFPKILEDIRSEGTKELGAGFDQPKPGKVEAEAAPAAKEPASDDPA